jgi:hypothetical protein
MFAKLGQNPRHACRHDRPTDIAVYAMHPIEHRRRHDRFKRLPCGRHFMDFIEKEFFRCRHADHKREVRGKEDDDDSGNSVP